MDESIEVKVKNLEPITNAEAKYFLNSFINKIKVSFNIPNVEEIDEYNYSEFLKCQEICSYITECPNINLSIHDFIDKLYHFSNIIFLNIDGELTPYLIDVTYSQFLFDKYPLHDSFISVPDVISDEYKKIFVRELRERGYIKLNTDILKYYFDIFVDAYNNRKPKEENNIITGSKVNNDKVYNKVINFLKLKGILMPVSGNKIDDYEKEKLKEEIIKLREVLIQIKNKKSDKGLWHP